MIPNHTQFLAAISERKKVLLRFYSLADSGVLDRVCAPMDDVLGAKIEDGLHRYWLWNYASTTDSHILGFLPEEIIELRVLSEVFAPADSVPRLIGGLPLELGAYLPDLWSAPRPE